MVLFRAPSMRRSTLHLYVPPDQRDRRELTGSSWHWEHLEVGWIGIAVSIRGRASLLGPVSIRDNTLRTHLTLDRAQAAAIHPPDGP
jgi:hypothetical protein